MNSSSQKGNNSDWCEKVSERMHSLIQDIDKQCDTPRLARLAKTSGVVSQTFHRWQWGLWKKVMCARGITGKIICARGITEKQGTITRESLDLFQAGRIPAQIPNHGTFTQQSHTVAQAQVHHHKL
jgi:hypothetical protein